MLHLYNISEVNHVKIRLLSLIFIFLISLNNLGAFEIQFPGEVGFYIGKPMIYVTTGTAGDPNLLGEEGAYTFGPIIVTLDGGQYYTCIFDVGTNTAIFFLGIDKNNKVQTQKNIRFGETELDISPAVVTLKYPLFHGQKWDNKNQKAKIVAKNITIPGFGKFPSDLTIDNVIAQTTVSSVSITVTAGTFDSLLVETTFSGSLIGIPATIIQRTWMSEDNVPIKRNFELITPLNPKPIVLYEMELSKPNPDIYDLNWDGVVNILDLMMVVKYYGTQPKSTRIPNPDINMDNVVDLEDMKMMISHFGEIYKK
jgi:hypothetical protein